MSNKTFEFCCGDSDLLALYDRLIQQLDILPKLIVKNRRAYDRMAVFCRRKNFAYLSLLDENGSFIERGFKIVFSVPQKILDPRIKIITEPHPGRFSHHVVVHTMDDIDNQLIEWLKQSYDHA